MISRNIRFIIFSADVVSEHRWFVRHATPGHVTLPILSDLRSFFPRTRVKPSASGPSVPRPSTRSTVPPTLHSCTYCILQYDVLQYIIHLPVAVGGWTSFAMVRRTVYCIILVRSKHRRERERLHYAIRTDYVIDHRDTIRITCTWFA